MRVQHLDTNKYIPLFSCVSNLFTSWHALSPQFTVYIVHGYLLRPYTAVHGVRILSGMGIESGWCRLLPALFQSTITGVVVWGLRSSSVAVANEGCSVKSHRPLWFGSSS